MKTLLEILKELSDYQVAVGENPQYQNHSLWIAQDVAEQIQGRIVDSYTIKGILQSLSEPYDEKLIERIELLNSEAFGVGGRGVNWFVDKLEKLLNNNIVNNNIVQGMNYKPNKLR